MIFRKRIIGILVLVIIGLNLNHPATGQILTTYAQSGFSCTQVSEMPQQECESLVALYSSTDGANWTNNSGWLSTNTPCKWFGIFCANGHVQQLQLHTNNLQGSLPPELSNLSDLQTMHLYHNQLSGSIPAELGNLQNLQGIALHLNQLSGSIPAELGNLSNLVVLQLHLNQLDGSIPAQLGNLENLSTLQLNDNKLSGTIPSELGQLANLELLLLSNNELEGIIPPELGDLSNLIGLWLSGNQLSGEIPTTLGNLANLQQLVLENNKLSGSIPVELGNLSELTRLTMGVNQLSGNIPSELGSLNKVDWLILSQNQLTGSIPPELGEMSSLTRLILERNQLSGSIPMELGNLTNLERFELFGNQLSGEIPPELGQLTNLINFQVHGNQLSGSIPEELGNLTKLTVFGLQNNQLSGEIPAELGNLTELRTLNFLQNKLTGDIPASLGNLVQLQLLLLGGNQLSGSIPPELGNLTNLQSLVLTTNQLIGGVPVELGDLTNLQILLLNNNPLSGPLPVSLTNLNLVTFFYSLTNLCEPADPAFQNWLASIENLDSTGIICSGEPSVDAGPDVTIFAGETLTASGSFSDPSGSSWNGSVDFGDGTPLEALVINEYRFDLDHTYVEAGNYVVTINITNDLGNTGSDSFSVTVITPQEAIEEIIQDINSLVADGYLITGQANALSVKLNHAFENLDQCDTKPAINQLQAFINQVNDYIDEGTLSEQQGQALIDAAQAIIHHLEASTTLPNAGGTVMFSPQIIVTAKPGTFSKPVQLECNSSAATLTDGMIDTEMTFELNATYLDGAPALPQQPFDLAVTYDPSELSGVVDESWLSLYAWEDENWVREASSSVDRNANTITARSDHLGLWSVSVSSHPIHLPIILGRSP